MYPVGEPRLFPKSRSLADGKTAGELQFQRHIAYADWDTQMVLYDKNEMEFFTALALQSESTPATSKSMITVLVGPAFRGDMLDLSSPRLCGRFHIAPCCCFRRKQGDGGDNNTVIPDHGKDGLLAVHPSALIPSDEGYGGGADDMAAIAAILDKLGPRQRKQKFVVYGIDAALGRLLACSGVDSGTKNCVAGDNDDFVSWRRRVSDWAKLNIRPNGPYLIFLSFCDSMYPLSFCAPAIGSGYYACSAGLEGQLSIIVGSVMWELEKYQRELVQRGPHRRFTFFVSVTITGCLDIQAVVVPLE